MILLTGDTHCPIDISKLNSTNFPLGNSLTKKDYLIILGDAGLVWSNRDKEDLYWQEWLNEKPWTTLFIDGNHENHVKLNQYPVEEWNGGLVHKIQPSIFHLMRSQIFTIEGKTFLTLGGAESYDKGLRKEGLSWWKEEVPSFSEQARCLSRFEEHGYVDVILTHEAPHDFAQVLLGFKIDQNPLHGLFKIMKTMDYGQWFCGHYHKNYFGYQGKINCLFDDIVTLTNFKQI